MSSRITRALLVAPEQARTQRELARIAGVDEGLTSKVVRRLEADGYLTRDEQSRVAVRDSELLLDAWRDAYDFERHEVVTGHMPGRTGEAVLRQITRVLTDAKQAHAATGLAAAWQITHFAAFRLVTIYLRDHLFPGLAEQLAFREGEPGANVWFVVPNDDGVFYGSQDRGRISCVHPIQVYVDLKAQPERAAEAAQRLRQSWRDDR